MVDSQRLAVILQVELRDTYGNTILVTVEEEALKEYVVECGMLSDGSSSTADGVG